MQKKQFEAFDVIGVITSCFPEKFGVPRQSGLAPAARAKLELHPPYNRVEMVQGLEEFSHIWIQFVFHQSVAEGWKTTVRPPRLGGRKSRGVLATRSPHRPNHLGLSVVRLQGISTAAGTVVLQLGGVDLLDGTPVIDIKPYVPYCDCPAGASDGWLQEDFPVVQIDFLPDPAAFCQDYESKTKRHLTALIQQVLQLDPRPASQRGRRSVFGMILWDVNIRWFVDGNVYTVTACELAEVPINK
ncbi:MAG: tRNA (N6-threonylcarbamoyladenosine(37)-N6)-methyltransferase TrmO [Deltaproteobacteria bacterium]|nr:tRNA (N6-threonylcarbamoyladenosine(37)-N6)-methyltransferase TrmO [Deltaproteobacteria bacterium]